MLRKSGCIQWEPEYLYSQRRTYSRTRLGFE